MDQNQQLHEIRAKVNLGPLRDLFSKFSLGEVLKPVIGRFANSTPNRTSTTPGPNPEPTGGLGIAEVEDRESSSPKPVEDSNNGHPDTGSSEVPNLEDPNSIILPCPKRENNDSGYSSPASTPTKDKNEILELKVFSDIKVPQELDSRFFDLRVLYSKPLLEAISKGKTNRGDISMKLKFMGIDEESAKPYIVIHCNKRVEKRVKNFFNQKHVRLDLEPHFLVHIVPNGLVSLSSLGSLFIYADRNFAISSAQITITNEETRVPVVATLGGILLATCRNTPEFYGMTAGHAIARAYGQKYYDAINPDLEQGGDSFSVEDGYDDDDDENDDDENDDDENDNDVKIGEYVDNSQSDGVILNRSGSVAHCATRTSLIGFVNGDELPPGEVNYDWGLIHLLVPPISDDLSFGGLSDDVLTLFSEGNPSLIRRTTVAVVVITSRGYQRGLLSANGSLILSAIGKELVSVFDLVLNSNSELIPGDSGSWVANEETGEVYGHIVSVDTFGEGYVMPIQGTLLEVKSHLGADSVRLASKQDLAAKNMQDSAGYLSSSSTDSGYSTKRNSPQYEIVRDIPDHK